MAPPRKARPGPRERQRLREAEAAAKPLVKPELGPPNSRFSTEILKFLQRILFFGVSILFRFLKHGGATLRLEEEPQLLSSHAPLPLAPETAQQAPQAVEMQHAPQADKLLLESSKGRLCSLWPNHGHGRWGKMLGKKRNKNLVFGQKAEKKRNSIWPHNMQRSCKTDKPFGKLFVVMPPHKTPWLVNPKSFGFCSHPWALNSA